MASSAFERAASFVMDRLEGGAAITDSPQDPGGLTRWGISARAHPELDVAHLTRDQAKAIYRSDYWDACHCDDLPEPIALVLFGAAVNQGPETAIKTLQVALFVASDGIVGRDTIQAAKDADVMVLLSDFCLRCWDRYAVTSGATTYLRGWTARLFRTLAEAMYIAAALEVPRFKRGPSA